jgi:hypothetical protein
MRIAKEVSKDFKALDQLEGDLHSQFVKEWLGQCPKLSVRLGLVALKAGKGSTTVRLAREAGATLPHLELVD